MKNPGQRHHRADAKALRQSVACGYVVLSHFAVRTMSFPDAHRERKQHRRLGRDDNAVASAANRNGWFMKQSFVPSPPFCQYQLGAQRGLVRQAFQPDPASPLSLKPGRQVRLESLTYKKVRCPIRCTVVLDHLREKNGRWVRGCSHDAIAHDKSHVARPSPSPPNRCRSSDFFHARR
jgi:hypothetical protein